MTKRDPDRPIFIVGMPRSGTTLLRSMLSAHPSIVIGPELHYFEAIRRYRDVDLNRGDNFERFWRRYFASPRFQDLMLDPAPLEAELRALPRLDFGTVLSVVMAAYARKLGKPRWGEKTPRNYRHIAQVCEWFPEARVIFMLRDPRSTVASIRRTPWGQRTSVEAHAAEWAESEALLRRWSTDPQVFPLRYEDLVADPEARMRDVCDFLGETFDESMLGERGGSIRQADRKGWGQDALDAATRPVSAGSLEKWREQMTPAQINLIEAITRPMADRQGYRFDDPPPGPSGRLAYAGPHLRIGAGRLRTGTALALRAAASRAGLTATLGAARLRNDPTPAAARHTGGKTEGR